MQIIDTHCHVSNRWYEPAESLLFEMDQHGVQHALLVQIGGEYDNSYQAQCVAAYPERLSSIVLVDVAQADAPDKLAAEAARGAVGVRLSAQARSPGPDPLAIWRKAQELGLPVSCQGRPQEFATADFASLVESLPELPIIIEHLGNVKHDNNPEPPYALAQQVFDLARFPNVYMKIHGLGEFAVRHLPVTAYPFHQPIPPFLEMVYDAFGPARMMWGSDYPPVSGREGYRNALQLTLAQFGDKARSDVEQIFAGCARSLFPTFVKT